MGISLILRSSNHLRRSLNDQAIPNLPYLYHAQKQEPQPKKEAITQIRKESTNMHKRGLNPKISNEQLANFRSLH